MGHSCNTQNGHRRRTKDEPPAREPVILCKTCCGQSWTRMPSRLRDSRDFTSVGDHHWRCKECRQPYAPERTPARGATIGSSAGSCADHGMLFGLESR